jgi:hypothetical protein
MGVSTGSRRRPDSTKDATFYSTGRRERVGKPPSTDQTSQMLKTILPPLAAIIALHPLAAAAQPATVPSAIEQETPTETQPAPEPPQQPPLLEQPAEAKPTPPSAQFGSRGQWVISDAFDLSASKTTYATSAASYTSYGITPSLDWFPVDSFSIGAFVSGSVSRATSYHNGVALETDTTTSWGLGARFGWNFALSRSLSIWPRLNFRYGASKTHPESGVGDTSSLRDLTDRGASVGVYVPLLMHVAPHAFGGFGPSFSRTLAHVQEGYAKPTGDGTFFGVSFMVGGWL